MNVVFLLNERFEFAKIFQIFNLFSILNICSKQYVDFGTRNQIDEHGH